MLEVRNGRVFFLGELGPSLVRKPEKMCDYIIRMMNSPVLSERQILDDGTDYPDAQAGRLKALICMGA